MELRGCWEPAADASDVNVLSKVLDDATRVRSARAPVAAYRPGEAPPMRGFVPVESVIDRAADAASAAVSADEPNADHGSDVRAPDPFVIQPEPGWADRTSLFGDPDA